MNSTNSTVGMAIINKNFLRFIISINLLELHKTRTWWSIIRTTPVQCDIVPFGKPNTLILTTQVIGANCLTKCLNATFAKPYLLFVDYIWLHWMSPPTAALDPSPSPRRCWSPADLKKFEIIVLVVNLSLISLKVISRCAWSF